MRANNGALCGKSRPIWPIGARQKRAVGANRREAPYQTVMLGAEIGPAAIMPYCEGQLRQFLNGAYILTCASMMLVNEDEASAACKQVKEFTICVNRLVTSDLHNCLWSLSCRFCEKIRPLKQVLKSSPPLHGLFVP